MYSFSNVNVGGRRSSRLIESSWVFNLSKKSPVFVNLEDDFVTKKTDAVVDYNRSSKRARQKQTDVKSS